MKYVRKIELVTDLKFNKTVIAPNHNSYFLENLDRTLYDAEEVVTITEVNNTIIENVVSEYAQLFAKRDIIPTEAQIEFARTTAKVLLGDLKDRRTIPVIPAPCGFGKSTITFVFIKEVCKAIKQGILNEGMIIVTDKLGELKKIHEELKKEIGNFKTETKNGKEYHTPFTYVLEGWTEKSYDEEVCLNKKVKSYKIGMCSNECPFFTECKISKQKQAQQFSPILLMTNARLETFGESINQYNYYIQVDKSNENEEKAISFPRTMIINDEKPSMIDSLSVSIPLINTIENDICLIPIRNETDKQEKDKLSAKWDKIRIILKDKLNHYSSKYERFLISNINNEPILLNDEEFILLWDKHMGNKYKNEIRHIHSVLTRGGLFCNTKKQGEFINTIFMKDLINDKFKTVIFDATALVDPEYSSSKGNAYENIIKFINIENIRTFEDVTFNFYQSHRINKSKFRSKNYLTSACARFVESMPTDQLTYVVTYREVASKILKEMKESGNILVKTNKEELWGNTNKVEVVTYDDDTLHYFGNTKGSNKAKDCVKMVQFGWNTLPDYIYATRYLCTDYNRDKMDFIFQKCSDLKTAESFSSSLTHSDAFKFDNPHLYLYQHYYMLTDFIQEVFRTKLRNYNFNKNVEIHCFQAEKLLIGMIEQLFPKCKVNIIYDTVSCFDEEKILQNGEGENIISKLIKWVKYYDGTPILVNDFKKQFELSDDYWKKLFRSNQKDKSVQLFISYWNQKGIERKANKEFGKGKWIYLPT
jgi:hypothetical protein